MIKQAFLALFLVFSIQILDAQDFYDFGIREIRITFEESNWEKKLKYYKSQPEEKRLTGSVVIDGVKYDSVGVRYKGNSSFNNVRRSEKKKLPINIKLDHHIKGQGIGGKYFSVKLSNAFRDPTFIREPLAYEIAQKYMPSPRSNFARVYVNDEYMGLYVNTESVDEFFIERHFGSQEGSLFKCDPDDWDAEAEAKGCTKSKEASLTWLGGDPDCYKVPYELKMGKKDDFKELMGLIKSLQGDMETIEKLLDIDQVLWMLAFNSITVNLDSYNGYLSHNYYLYQDEKGVFHPILWDMNMSFGGFRFDGQKLLSEDELIRMHPLSGINDKNRPLISKLLQDEFYRKLYQHHVRVMMEDHLQRSNYRFRALEMANYIDLTVQQDGEKLYGYDDFKDNMTKTVKAGKTPIIGLTELMENRTTFLNELPFIKAELPTIQDLGKSTSGDNITFKVKVNAATKVILAHRNGKTGNFALSPMKDDGTLGDETVGDGIYSLQVEKSEVRQYYFIAEGMENIATLPARASFDFLTN